MPNKFTLDLARAALVKAEAVPEGKAIIVPICTTEQIVEIQRRIKAAMERATDSPSADKASNEARAAK
jgi:hypothetical protein